MIESSIPLVCKLCKTPLESDKIEGHTRVATCSNCGHLNNIDKALKVTAKKVQRAIADELEESLRKIAKDSKGFLKYKPGKR